MAKAASKKSSKQIESLDLEELAAHLCGLQDKDDYDISDLDDGLMEKYDISFTVGGKPEFEFHIKNVQGTVSKKG